MAAASWLAWMCFRGVMGPPSAVIALAGIAASAALIRRHTGMEVCLALCLIALVGLVAVVWVVFALLAVALVAGGDGSLASCRSHVSEQKADRPQHRENVGAGDIRRVPSPMPTIA